MRDFAGKFLADMTGNFHSSCIGGMTKVCIPVLGALKVTSFLFTRFRISCMADVAVLLSEIFFFLA